MAQSCSTREVPLACKLFWGILFRPDSCGWPKRAPNTRLLLYCVLQQSATRVQPRRGRCRPSTALLRLVALLRAPEGFQLSTARHSLKRRPVRRGAKDRAECSGPSSCRPRSPWRPASARPASCSRGSWQRPAPGCRRFPALQSAGWRRGAEPGSRVTACLRAGARSAFPHIQSRRFRFYCKLQSWEPSFYMSFCSRSSSCSVPSSARPAALASRPAAPRFGAAPRRTSRAPAPPLRAPRRRPARNPGSGPGTGSGRAALLPRRLKGRPTSAGWAAPGVGFPVPEVSRGPALAAAARPRCARVLPAAPPGSDSLSDV